MSNHDNAQNSKFITVRVRLADKAASAQLCRLHRLRHADFYRVAVGAMSAMPKPVLRKLVDSVLIPE